MTADLWKDLHMGALRFEGTTDGPFLARFRAELLKITRECGCKNFWDTWTRANPPTYVPSEAYFEWTIRVHNAVNQKLGKPIITVEDGRAIFVPMLSEALVENK